MSVFSTVIIFASNTFDNILTLIIELVLLSNIHVVFYKLIDKQPYLYLRDRITPRSLTLIGQTYKF